MVYMLPCFRLFEVVPEATVEPEGTDVKSTLWVAVSWFKKVIVVPAATVKVLGEKLDPDPAPRGIVTVMVPDAADALDELVAT